jgi:hypothetical protein
MHPKIPQNSRFRQIIESIETESYVQKTTKKIAGSKKPVIFEGVIAHPNRKQHAILLKNILTESRSSTRDGKLSTRQGLAIEQLVRYKKDELAIQKFLEHPKHTFKTQGTEYELIQTNDGRYSCVDKKQYQKGANGMWISKEAPYVTFYGVRVADPKSVSKDQISPIDEILDRPLEATYMVHMLDVTKHAQWRPSFSKEFVTAELSKKPSGAFFIYNDKREDRYSITYKIDNVIVDEFFDKDTGIMETNRGVHPQRTIQTVIRNLESMQSQRADPEHATQRRERQHNASAAQSRCGPRKPITQAEADARENIERYDLDYFPNGLAVPYRENNRHYLLVRVRNSQEHEKKFKLLYDPQTELVRFEAASRPVSIEEFLESRSIYTRNKVKLLN